ncbi:glycerol phosphate lipoteichoic acid synthase [Bacillus pseudomycoides]|uniref:Glycerol phosphate lipoteichoic acid synthase n=2 Tax=Bacillaceae TaxID=186817 RepID=A0AA91VBK3_9BACI|nr:glycerol phosphate lipoteichoic acid synthase [Bacillus sp. AFS098217]PED81904.1 glycerol phosphate lipoteichoic acid synthase [Bacillus pseudomycoides]PEU08014.1 glycerol phosphate lipoteichoic acid synthase [Bacillus sp. AFS019443]PEU14268.1 glycerol phosphate lipoteichoic acid synthase [Bacillus sp. AFS014408]PFW59117.1 glycerol phosphate lipoteichoic acid synthase [Bacillus sp. AFS075034]
MIKRGGEMKQLLLKSKRVLSNHFGFFIFAVVLFWLKTYAAYVTEFDLGISNTIQKFLLFFNPLSSAVLFLGLALFAKGKRSYIWLIIINLLLSILLYSNVVYYRFFSDFITFPTLTQTNNFGDLGGSILALLHLYDPLYFLDTIILFVLVKTKFADPKPIRVAKHKLSLVFITGILIFSINLGLAEMDRPQLLTRTFDRNYIVKYLGAYNYTIYDGIQSLKASTERALADGDNMTGVRNYITSNYASPNPEYFGKGKGMNVIYIHLESFQNFLINYKLNGQEVTPFLNSFTHDANTLYFDNFFHQTGQGKTSDAEFMLENSLFGLPQGSVFTNKAHNTYQAAPAILGQQGYTSAVFHGNYKTFWNRDDIYKSFGFNKFFDASYYDMNEKDVVNYGLKDKPFFNESIPMLQTLKQPFYAKFITLSNHFPYPINKDEATIEPAKTGDSSVDTYFQTARYLDEAVKSFMDYLKQSGLYDNSIIVMYGDHYGISDNHNAAMSQIMGKEINSFENAQLQRVPLIIHVPGMKGGVQHQYGGEIDVLPTLLHLLGTDTKNYIQFGTDLLSPEHQQVVPFRNGNYVSPAVTALNGKYYDTTTGKPVEATDEIKQNEKMVQQKLKFSDEVVNGDLLRFYTPEGFTPVDRTKYNYNHQDKNKKKVKTTQEG